MGQSWYQEKQVNQNNLDPTRRTLGTSATRNLDAPGKFNVKGWNLNSFSPIDN